MIVNRKHKWSVKLMDFDDFAFCFGCRHMRSIWKKDFFWALCEFCWSSYRIPVLCRNNSAITLQQLRNKTATTLQRSCNNSAITLQQLCNKSESVLQPIQKATRTLSGRICQVLAWIESGNQNKINKSFRVWNRTLKCRFPSAPYLCCQPGFRHLREWWASASNRPTVFAGDATHKLRWHQSNFFKN
jgi:hypothetical protein